MHPLIPDYTDRLFELLLILLLALLELSNISILFELWRQMILRSPSMNLISGTVVYILLSFLLLLIVRIIGTLLTRSMHRIHTFFRSKNMQSKTWRS